MYGKKLKEIRNTLSATQEKMAELMNMSKRTYISYERDENNPPYSMLVQLCIKYKVNLNWFIADTGEMFNERQASDTKDGFEQNVVEVLKKYGLLK